MAKNIIPWSIFKMHIDMKKMAFQELDLTTSYHLLAIDGNYTIETYIHRDGDMPAEVIEYEADYQSLANGQNIIRSADGLPTSAINRFPFGYTVFPVGQADDIVNGTFGGGNAIYLDKDTLTINYQMLNCWYAIGGIATWGADTQIRDTFTATLIAPATVGTNGSGFDYTKAPTGAGFNVYVPVAAGTGDWDLDLTPTFASKQLLNVTLVPVAGNTGFFDIHKPTNVVTINANQMGGYNLYDADIPLFMFARHLWGRPGGGVKRYAEDGLVAKLMYPNWFIKFDLSIYDAGNRTTEDVSFAMEVITGAKMNV